ncbi:MAG: hypothetical protein EB060_09625 [Proteobacteria bacterium]|nr:hypothetical protein [Pseudomonadota bacterium]
MRLMSFVGWLLCSLASLAGEAVTGPASVDRGKSVVLSVPVDKFGDAVEWTVNGTTSYLTSDDKTTHRLAILDIESDVVVSVIGWDKRASGLHVIRVGGPTPPDNPDDRPKPPAPLPDGKYGLAGDVSRWVAATVPTLARSKAQPLAKSFRSISSAIAAGGLRDAESILKETLTANQLVLSDQRAAWVEWGKKLEERLTALDAHGKLAQPSDYQTAWDEIATGLESIK